MGSIYTYHVLIFNAVSQNRLSFGFKKKRPNMPPCTMDLLYDTCLSEASLVTIFSSGNVKFGLGNPILFLEHDISHC
jgi:hypothetical protein